MLQIIYLENSFWCGWIMYKCCQNTAYVCTLRSPLIHLFEMLRYHCLKASPLVMVSILKIITLIVTCDRIRYSVPTNTLGTAVLQLVSS